MGGECSGLHKRASELIAKGEWLLLSFFVIITNYFQGKFAEAVPILRQASEGGDVGAQRDLAILLKVSGNQCELIPFSDPVLSSKLGRKRP